MLFESSPFLCEANRKLRLFEPIRSITSQRVD
jgi:hypothetical protein